MASRLRMILLAFLGLLAVCILAPVAGALEGFNAKEKDEDQWV